MKIKTREIYTEEKHKEFFETIKYFLSKVEGLEIRGATLYVNFYDKETKQLISFVDFENINLDSKRTRKKITLPKDNE